MMNLDIGVSHNTQLSAINLELVAIYDDDDH